MNKLFLGAAAALLLAAGAARADPPAPPAALPQQYQITLSPGEIAFIAALLRTQPYEKVVLTLDSIQKQVNAAIAVKAAAAAPQEPTPAP
jgi:hypothetical protein